MMNTLLSLRMSLVLMLASLVKTRLYISMVTKADWRKPHFEKIWPERCIN